MTTDANGIVGPIHPKAMPVMLASIEQHNVWHRAPWSEAVALRRPLPDAMMRIATTGAKKDRHVAHDDATKDEPYQLGLI